MTDIDLLPTTHTNLASETQSRVEAPLVPPQTLINLGGITINSAMDSKPVGENEPSGAVESFEDGRWSRSIVDIPGVQGIRVSFRGKHELPEITADNKPNGVSRFVALTPGYTGRATEVLNADVLGSWVARNNGSRSDTNPGASIEANLVASMENKEQGDMVLITDTTPLGFATLMRGLSEAGIVSEDQLSSRARELMLLRNEKPANETESQILERALLDIAVLAKKNSLKPEKVLQKYLGLLVGDSESLNQAEEELRTATDEILQEEVKLRYNHQYERALSSVVDSNTEAVWDAQKNGATSDEVEALRVSLDTNTSERINEQFKDSISQLETVEQREQKLVEFAEEEHIVLVHRDRGGLHLNGKIESLGDHVDRDGFEGFQLPGVRIRDTVHFSLNHTVSNPFSNHGVYKSEQGIQSNVVMPLADTVRENGLPVSLYGIDTYFDHQVSIPEGSRVISISSSTESGIIQSDTQGGYELVIPLNLDSNGARILLQEYSKELNPNQVRGFEEGVISEAEESFKKAHDKWRQQQIEADKLEPGDPFIEAYRKNPEPTFAIALQQVITNREINRMSEDHMVRADGMSKFIETEGFDNKIVAIAEELGIGYGLHTYDSRFHRREEALKSIFSEFKRMATDPNSSVNDVNTSELWKLVPSLELDQIMPLILHGYLSFEQNSFTPQKRKVGRVLG